MDRNFLNRKIGFFSATNIVVANIIGAGIFTTSGLLLANLHDPKLMLLLWGVGGIIALCGAISYGELGALMPEAGGEYLFLSKIFHPVFGFLSGWISFIVGFSAPIAASAMGCSEYLFRAFPGMTGWFEMHFNSNPKYVLKLVSIIIILIFTLIHARGLKKGTYLQNALTILKVAIIIAFIVMAFFFGSGDYSNFDFHIVTSKGIGNWNVIGLSLMWIMFSYSGWNASTSDLSKFTS